MRIFITGVKGFLGSALARHWRARGHDVSGSERQQAEEGVVALPFGQTPDVRWFGGAGAVVHCAYDRTAGVQANIEGTKLVYRAAAAAGVRRQVFVSSYSARPDAVSDYGRMKFALESFFLEQGQTVVRPGLVAGDGGLFGRNARQILRTPLMPLVDGGHDLVPLIALDDFVFAMTAIVEGSLVGAYNLFVEPLVSMRDLVEMINQAAGRRALYLPVPASWVAFFLKQCQRLGGRLAVDADNLRALKQNQQCIHCSDLKRFVDGPVPISAAVRAAIEPRLRPSARQ